MINFYSRFCFSPWSSTHKCCQSLASFSYTLRQRKFLPKSSNWHSKHCGYFYLMLSTVHYSHSLFTLYTNNMKLSLSLEEMSSQNHSQIKLNNQTFFISNEWLNYHATGFNFSVWFANQSARSNDVTEKSPSGSNIDRNSSNETQPDNSNSNQTVNTLSKEDQKKPESPVSSTQNLNINPGKQNEKALRNLF
jgi:hypothetical protein